MDQFLLIYFFMLYVDADIKCGNYYTKIAPDFYAV